MKCNINTSAPFEATCGLPGSLASGDSPCLIIGHNWEIRANCIRLKQLIRDLDAELQTTVASRRYIQAIAKRLCELRDRVETQFSYEGLGGCIGDETDASPELLGQAADLNAEHQALMIKIRQAIQQAAELNRGAVSELAMDDFLRYVRELLIRIRQHEIRENALIVRAHNEDIEIGD